MTDAPEGGRITSDNSQLSLFNPGRQERPVEFLVSGSPHLSAINCTATPDIAKYVAAAIADNTRRAYRQDLDDFHSWGGVVPCTPEMFAAFIAERASTLSPHSLTRRVVGIGRAHVSQGYPDPAKNDLVRTVLRGARRTSGVSQRQAAPLLREDIFALLPNLRGAKGVRDRALLLLGFAAAFRRSELVALDVQDLQEVPEGLIVHLRHSKTDQTGEGRKIGVPFGRTSACPVKAVTRWLEVAKIESGPVFRAVRKGGMIGAARLSAQAVNLIVKEHVERIGLAASEYSGHSLRSGLVTSAARSGVSSYKIRQQTGHRSDAMLARYIRDADLFVGNAAGVLL